jgi:S-adenosylmethionine/arginine decarboxylase-like enzyme
MIVRDVCFNPETSWGISCSVDVKNCDPAILRNAELIKDYVIKLCDLIDMKRFGDCQVVHFGEDEKVAGYSMVQLIETSLISGHFANATNAAYIDIFSCKAYDPETVANFTKEYFKGDAVTLVTTNRV